uniref:Ribonuclease 3 n=1 Tax=Desulfobacca acetoxidans TaxID=60893 RepID=A0A7V4G668_9BACT
MKKCPKSEEEGRGAGLPDLARRLGRRFKDPGLLERALRHSSYCHEFPEVGPSNEPLEFLGDAVLALAVSHLLLEEFPESTEGELSRRRAALVNARQLAALARDLELGSYLLLGRGEERQAGREKPSLLADALEAVLAAVYLDGGFRAAQRLVRRWFTPLLRRQEALPRDFKTALQEYTQARFKLSPHYHLLEAGGPGHAPHFRIELRLGERVLAQGEGPSKKQAAQQAAERGLQILVAEEKGLGGGPGEPGSPALPPDPPPQPPL